MPIRMDTMGAVKIHGFIYLYRQHQGRFPAARTRVNGSGRLRRHVAGQRRKMMDAAVPATQDSRRRTNMNKKMISEATGKFAVTMARENEAFVVFGACMPQ